MLDDSPGDPQPAREMTHSQFPGLSPCSLTRDTKAPSNLPNQALKEPNPIDQWASRPGSDKT